MSIIAIDDCVLPDNPLQMAISCVEQVLVHFFCRFCTDLTNTTYSAVQVDLLFAKMVVKKPKWRDKNGKAEANPSQNCSDNKQQHEGNEKHIVPDDVISDAVEEKTRVWV